MSSLPAFRGRGLSENPPNRFDRLHAEIDPEALDDERRQAPTTFLRDASRSVLSRNGSPDIPFDYSLNPYRGCEHGCSYCLHGDTLILMGDSTTRRLADVRKGDEIYGTIRRGHYRHLAQTNVLDHWRTAKPAYRVRLADGTVLVASGDHRFLTERGWKHVTEAEAGQRPHLTLNNRLLGIGAFTAGPRSGAAYRRGYLCGLIRGDGHLASYAYDRPGRLHGNQHQFRLALADTEALDRATHYLRGFDVETRPFTFQQATPTRRPVLAIRTSARKQVERVRALVAWPAAPSDPWRRGFLAGLFDAEGSYSGGALRITNADRVLLGRLEEALAAFGFRFTYDVPRLAPGGLVQCLRVLGGLREHLRFFHTTHPAIRRKCDVEGIALKNDANLQVVEITPLRRTHELFDVTTGTGDFIANGVVSHNCYARPTHEYLGFSPGLDFETRIVVKHDAPRLLSAAFQKPSWTPAVVSVSGATDPYQPVERRLQLTRACLGVFLRHRNPVSIITKNALVVRDLDLLAELAARDLVHVRLSITSLRDDVIGAMEPRTSRPAARLRAVEKLAEAGVPVAVHAAPLIPGLTDEELPAIYAAAAEAGAQAAGFMVLRLPGAVGDLFPAWLQQHFPDRYDKVMGRLTEVRGGRLDEGRFHERFRLHGPWAEALRQIARVTARRLGLDGPLPPLATHHFRRLPKGQMDLF